MVAYSFNIVVVIAIQRMLPNQASNINEGPY